MSVMGGKRTLGRQQEAKVALDATARNAAGLLNPFDQH